MPNKRKICTENINSNQSIYIASLNSYYQPESVLNSAYRKVLDFKENAEKILEKEKSETLSLTDFSKAILDSRSFEISLQHNCIKLKCYITLEKDKDAKKKMRNGEQGCSQSSNSPMSSNGSGYGNSATDMNMNSCYNSADPKANSGGAKKVNVEVIMKSNTFRVEENEKTTRMELIKNTENCGGGGNMLRFTYYVKPECEKLRETNSELFEKGRLVVFTNDFFTVYQDTASGEMNISLNEIVQSHEEQKRTEALGEKLFLLLKDRPRHRALLTNECKLNHSNSASNVMAAASMINAAPITITMTTSQSHGSNLYMITNDNNNNNNNNNNNGGGNGGGGTSQEDETYYTRELIQIYGQPIVPSFHKYFNYQLSNTHYGYRTLRRLLNCDILKKFVKITKEEIKSLDRVVEFVQLTPEKCLGAFQLNLTSFYDPSRFENGIVKNWLDVWYVDRLKEKYTQCSTSSPSSPSVGSTSSSSSSSSPSPSSSTSSSSSPSSSSPNNSDISSSGISSASSSASSSHSFSSLQHTQVGSTSLFTSSPSSWSISPNDPLLSFSGSNSTSNGPNWSTCGNTMNGSQSGYGLFVHHSNCDNGELGDDSNYGTPSECDQGNHLWFCLRDYACLKMCEFLHMLRDYIHVRTNRSELILVQTAHPVFEYRHVLSEARRILTLFLSKSTINKTMDELVGKQFPMVACEHIENLLSKFLIMDVDKKVVGFTALFEILMILKRELSKEKNDEMKYSHFLCTLERANQEKLKMAIVQLKCVPCLNKFTTDFSMSSSSSQQQQQSSLNVTNGSSSGYSPNQMLKSSSNMVSQANMSRLLKQMSLIVSTELQQIAIDLYEKMDESGGDKPVKYIKLKEEFRHHATVPGSMLQSPTPTSTTTTTTSTASSTTTSPIPLSHSSPQFKSLMNSSNSSHHQQQQSNNHQTSSQSTSSSSSSAIPPVSNVIPQATKQQLSALIQMNSLTASFNKVDLTSNSSSTNAKSTLKQSQQQQQQQPIPQIFNPKKDLEQFYAKEKKNNAPEMSAFRSTASSSFFYSADTC